MNKARRILIFSRDPGGANTVMPLIQPLKNNGFEVLLWGKDTALDKYQQAGFTGRDINELDHIDSVEAFESFLKGLGVDFILTGTSAEDKTENLIWLSAKKLEIPSAAILDQWVNYDIRFSPYKVSERTKYIADPDLTWCPDTIFVMDDEAHQEMLAVGFNKNQIAVSGQPYFEWIQKRWKENADQRETQAQALKKSQTINKSSKVISFISEPLTELHKTSNGAIDFGYTEKSTFAHFITSLKNYASQNSSDHHTVIIKLHPRENPDNYNDVLENFTHPNIRIIIDQQIAPWDLIAMSSAIIGMSSMLLLETYLVGKPLLSIQIDRVGNDPFILSRRGYVKVAENTQQLEEELSNCLNTDDTEQLPTIFGAQACQNVVDVINQKLVTCSI